MKRTLLLMLCGAAGCVLADQASASIVGDPITVTLQNGSYSGSFSVTLAECTYDPSSHGYYYQQQGSRSVVSSVGGQVLGTFSGLSMFMLDDPNISLGFALQSASSTPTIVTISSGLLSFASIANPTAHSSAAVTITDNTNDGTGVTLTGNYGANAYEANYNGLIPAGTLYSVHCPSFNSPGDGSSNSENGNNNAGISGSVSSMSTSFSFVISANDSVSGSSNFSVTPAPGALALLGIGGLMASRRRR
jgi:MYXO-CTERM domain-containing protein